MDLGPLTAYAAAIPSHPRPLSRPERETRAHRVEHPVEVWDPAFRDGSDQVVALADGVAATGPRRLSRGETSLPPMSAHVVALCHAGRAEASWTDGGRTARAALRPGVVSLLPAGLEGRWILSAGVEISHLYLPEARLQTCAAAIGARTKPQFGLRLGVEDSHLASILSLLADHAVHGDVTSRPFAEQCVDLLCAQLIRQYGASDATVDGPRRGLADWQLRRVAAFVRSRLDEAIALADLADLVGLSRFHFCTAFRRATGQTPHDWLTGLRMDHAANLLADQRLPITQIALAVGYETPSSFAARFKQRMGLTPTEYRRRLA